MVALTSDDLLGLAQVLEGQKKYDEAIKQCELALELRYSNLISSTAVDPLLIPRVTECMSHLADLQQLKGDPDDAVETYKNAIQLYRNASKDAGKEILPIILENMIVVIKSLSTLQVVEKKFDDARETIDSLFIYAKELYALGPDHHLASEIAKAEGFRSLGTISQKDCP